MSWWSSLCRMTDHGGRIAGFCWVPSSMRGRVSVVVIVYSGRPWLSFSSWEVRSSAWRGVLMLLFAGDTLQVAGHRLRTADDGRGDGWLTADSSDGRLCRIAPRPVRGGVRSGRIAA